MSFYFDLTWRTIVGIVSITANYLEVWLLASAVVVFLYLLVCWIRKVRAR